MKYILIAISICVFFLSSCTMKLMKPKKGYKSIQKVILSLEANPSIQQSRLKEVRQVLEFAMNPGFPTVMTTPFKIDSSYQYGGELLLGFYYGTIYYGLENYKSFSRDQDKLIEFNIKTYIRGCEGMLQWYEGILRKKGKAGKLEQMEVLRKDLKDNTIREKANEFVLDQFYSRLKNRSEPLILIYF